MAFVIDAYARRIVGWRVPSTLHIGLGLDALEQALYDRHKSETEELIHHTERGVDYLSIRYAERLQDAGIEPSVGSVGDSYDNALAETINGLYNTDVIRQQGPWRHIEAVEFATLSWWIGSTTGVYLNRSVTSHPAKKKSSTIRNCKGQPWRTDSN